MEADVIFRWKVCSNGIRHLGKYDAATGKWIKWESQTNRKAVAAANEQERKEIERRLC